MTTPHAPTLADPLSLLSRHALAAASAGDEAFLRATPFSHCVIDDFFDDAFAQRLLREFPGFERGNTGMLPFGWTVPREAEKSGYVAELREEKPAEGRRCAALRRRA